MKSTRTIYIQQDCQDWDVHLMMAVGAKETSGHFFIKLWWDYRDERIWNNSMWCFMLHSRAIWNVLLPTFDKLVVLKFFVVRKNRNHGGHPVNSCLFIGESLLKPKLCCVPFIGSHINICNTI